MQTVTRRASSKWVTGLRPKLEEAFSRGAFEGTLVGKAELRGLDMLEVVEVKLVPGKPEGPSFEVSGRIVTFKFPLEKGQNLEDVYYPLMGMLNRV
ncbi:hypothetical protein [Thermococcus gammatolerans]|uniref:Uncharacterized protein n=1 Tax=Thermococcus gammatolerans (strain DSM 15229 / JCM 11827 / EJ3) TaxID=593117 RepID=C5A7H6_THEGJ|nr:hypothetical protein [Thermococcus gammatolerans]ACS34188.1 Conserved hypothetical protein [Thermococcus gammatolerans EJ3]